MMRTCTSLVVALGLTLSGPSSLAWGQDRTSDDDRGSDWLDIELNKSIVLETPRVPRAISITNPAIADVVQLGSATKWQLQGASIGTTDLVIQFGPGEPPLIYEITVHQDLSDLVRRVRALLPDDPPQVYPLNGRIVVEGYVPDLDTLEQVAMVARMYDEEFVNLMRVGGDHQVQLEVIYAEVSRTALRNLGVNFLWSLPQAGAGLLDNVAQIPRRGFGDGAFPGLRPFPLSTDSFNLMGYIGQGINVLGILSVMDSNQLAKVMSQPTLVALSGQKAEFLSGGQVPVVIPNPMGIPMTRFEDYGTRMLFIPTVLADGLIDIQVDLELSDLDPANSVPLAGGTVPALSTRRVKSHVRLKSGMTFAIAGMLEERVNALRAGVPGLGRIPVIGALFRNVRHMKEETELMVYVTPRLVRPMAEDEVPPILSTTEDHNPSDLKLYLLGGLSRDRSRTVAPTGPIGLHR